MATITLDMVISSILSVELSPEDETAKDNWVCMYQECLYECLGVDEADKNDETAYSDKANMLIGHIVALELMNRGALSSNSFTDSGGRYLSKAKAGSTEAEWDQFDEKKSSSRMSIGDLYTTTLNKARGLASELGCWVPILDIEADADNFNCFVLCAPGEA